MSMQNCDHLSGLMPVFGSSCEYPGSGVYHQTIETILKRIFAHDKYESDVLITADRILSIEQMLPLVKWIEWEANSCPRISIFLLCRYRPNVAKFFYDMMNRWLLPGKKIKIGLFFSADIQIVAKDELDDLKINSETASLNGQNCVELFTVSEMIVCVEDNEHLNLIKRNLQLIEPELKLGISSIYHALRIMEIKGLATDEKMSLIQEKIFSLVQRRPKDFDYDVFNQMQQFLVKCREEFKDMREYQHMSRIISFFYLFRRDLRQKIEFAPRKRHLSLKFLRARLHYAFGVKKVLAIIVGINFLRENELFEQRHFIRALQSHIPGIRGLEDSFLIDEDKEDRIQIFYLEVEKEDGSEISKQDISYLRRVLPEELKRRVEQLMRPVFMPRNEEEVMRHILSLSSELKYVRDLPQVVISFDEQTDTDLFFTVILARILFSDANSVKKMFQKNTSLDCFFLDRVRKVGMLRNRYPKEVAVLRAKLPNMPFLREDHSVDLYKARQEVMSRLENLFGEVRDFNGGMIAKQMEVFLALKQELGDLGASQEFLLENFFHSIFPVEQRSVLSPEALKVLFLMLLSLIDREKLSKEKILFESAVLGAAAYVMVAFSDGGGEKKIFETIDHLDLLSSDLVFVHLKVLDVVYIGYIYFSDKVSKLEAFLKAIKLGLDF